MVQLIVPKTRLSMVIILTMAVNGCTTAPPAVPPTTSKPIVSTLSRQATIDAVQAVLKEHDLVPRDIDATGKIETEWRLTEPCWRGLLYGGKVPCSRTRAIAQVTPASTGIEVAVHVEEQKRKQSFVLFLIGAVIFDPMLWQSVESGQESENDLTEEIQNVIRPAKAPREEAAPAKTQ